MNLIKLSSTICIALFCYTAQSQSTWDIQTSLGIASENNLGDTGLRLSTKASRYFGRWGAFAQLGTFQMLKSNENWTGDQAYQNKRSLSTANIDLGGSLDFVQRSRLTWNVNVAGSYRVGRQLWPELSVLMNGTLVDLYTFEKIKEFGYAIGMDLLPAPIRFWLRIPYDTSFYLLQSLLQLLHVPCYRISQILFRHLYRH